MLLEDRRSISSIQMPSVGLPKGFKTRGLSLNGGQTVESQVSVESDREKARCEDREAGGARKAAEAEQAREAARQSAWSALQTGGEVKLVSDEGKL